MNYNKVMNSYYTFIYNLWDYKEDPYEIFNSDEFQLAWNLVNKNLNERQIKVMNKRFIEKLTLREIGKHMGFHPERVRQTISKAIRILKQKKCFDGVSRFCYENSLKELIIPMTKSELLYLSETKDL